MPFRGIRRLNGSVGIAGYNQRTTHVLRIEELSQFLWLKIN
jgi:hypothetical protein